MKASELRQSILQAAVQGKLVPQDLHDEPASALLKRIRTEKAKLIKEGKIKKEKPLPPITEDEISYDLPERWTACRITDLVNLYDGAIRRGPFGSAITKDMFVPKDDKTYKVYEQGNAIRKTVEYGDYYISEKHYEKLKSFHIVPGDIIISCAGTLGETYILPDNAPAGIINQALLRLNINKNIVAISYFLLCFKSITQQQIVLSSYGSAMKNLVSIQWLKENAIFPIPPLDEQHRIVAKVDELMAMCDELDAAENELETLENHFIETLPKSILQMAVQGKLVSQNLHDEPATELLARIRAEKSKLIKEGKLKKEKSLPPITEEEIPYDLPDGWVWCKLGNITNKIHYGYTASAQDAGEAKLLRITDIQENKVDWENVPFCSIAKERLSDYGLQQYDILIARTGGTIGKTYLVRNVIENAVFASYLIRAVPFPQLYSIEYLKFFLESPIYWEQLRDKTMGTGQPNVNGQSLSNLILPLPPLAEQQRIVGKVKALFLLCDELKKNETILLKDVETKVIPFPQETESEEEIGIAARGNMQNLSDEAKRDIDELFGDDGNA